MNLFSVEICRLSVNASVLLLKYGSVQITPVTDCGRYFLFLVDLVSNPTVPVYCNSGSIWYCALNTTLACSPAVLLTDSFTIATGLYILPPLFPVKLP